MTSGTRFTASSNAARSPCSCRLSVMLTKTLPGNPTRARVQTGAVPLDHPGLLEPLHAAQAGRLRRSTLYVRSRLLTRPSDCSSIRMGWSMRSSPIASACERRKVLRILLREGVSPEVFCTFAPFQTISSIADATLAPQGESHAHRCTKRNQGPRIPGRPRAGRGPRTGRGRPRGAGRDRRRGGIGFADADYQRVGAKIAPDGRGGLRQVRDDREGEGAAAGGVRAAARGPDALHLPAPRAGPEADRGAGQGGRHLHRLRDGDRAGRLAAAAHADERGRRPHVDAGRRVLPGEGATAAAGILLGGVPGVAPANVVILGGGVVGHERGARWRSAWARTSRSSTAP